MGRPNRAQGAGRSGEAVDPPSESRVDRGLRIRREVVGEEYVARAYERAGEFGEDFQDLVSEYCWGASWGRSALSRRDRSLLNLAIIGTLGRSDEFRLHVAGALRNGVTDEELQDTLIHLAVYAGIPAGVEAFRIAGEVRAQVRQNAEPTTPEPASAAAPKLTPSPSIESEGDYS